MCGLYTHKREPTARAYVYPCYNIVMNYKRGFTLMEVMVTMTIFLVMSGITFSQNTNSFTKIRFNSYLHQLIINFRQLQLFGAAAGDITSSNGVTERIQGAGFEFRKSTPTYNGVAIIPFYDKTNSDSNSVLATSNLFYDLGEKISSMKFDYENFIKIERICEWDKSNYLLSNCNHTKMQVLFIRPNVIPKVFFDDTVNNSTGLRDFTVASVYSTFVVKFAYLNYTPRQCLTFQPLFGFSYDTDGKCDLIDSIP